jgi:hypothetical protein
MGLADFSPGPSSHDEHPAISEILDEIFESGLPEQLVRAEIAEQVAEAGAELDEDATLPETPYVWDKTQKRGRKWVLMAVEFLIGDEHRPDKRFNQAACRATEHINPSASESVKSALRRETFYKEFEVENEVLDEPFQLSAPSAELLREVLLEVERRLRQREDVTIEDVLREHRTETE